MYSYIVHGILISGVLSIEDLLVCIIYFKHRHVAHNI